MPLYSVFTPGEVAAAGVVFPVAGAVLVALRIHTRLRHVKKLGIDDWLVLPALVLMIAMGVLTIWGVALKAEGYKTTFKPGPHPELDLTQVTVEKVFWNTEWMQPLAAGFIKLSFIFFFRRVFNVGPNSSAFNIISLASTALIIVWMLGFTLAVLLICPGHPGKYWGTRTGRAQYCWDTQKFLYALSWSDVVTDLIVLIMPIPSVAKLHMALRKKFAVVAIFGLGALAVAASITRAVFYVELLHSEKTVVAKLDPNMINTNGLYWMLMETGLALIAVNLPLMYGLIGRKGVGTIIRYARSFGSLRSHNSNQRGTSNKASSSHKSSAESPEHRDDIQLVYGGQNTRSEVTYTEPLEDIDVESGNINVTRAYGVDRPKGAYLAK